MHTQWVYGETGELVKVVTTHPNGSVHTRWKDCVTRELEMVPTKSNKG